MPPGCLTVQVPSAPLNLRREAATSNSITVGWDRPSGNPCMDGEWLTIWDSCPASDPACCQLRRRRRAVRLFALWHQNLRLLPKPSQCKPCMCGLCDDDAHCVAQCLYPLHGHSDDHARCVAWCLHSLHGHSDDDAHCGSVMMQILISSYQMQLARWWPLGTPSGMRLLAASTAPRLATSSQARHTSECVWEGRE